MLVDERPRTLDVSGFPTTITAGVAGSFTVTAKNADGTTNTSYRGTVHFTKQRSPGRPARRLHLHRRRRGRPHLQRHSEDGRQPVHHHH